MNIRHMSQTNLFSSRTDRGDSIMICQSLNEAGGSGDSDSLTWLAVALK